MPVGFDQVAVGQEYTRPELAALWGYESYEALSRGVVTPRNTPFIILFITREKQEFLTQYEDRLENGILDIEGETNHAADDRIIRSATADDEIHLFYRDRHHMPFTYYGEICLSRHEKNTEAPSRFTFRVPSEHPDDTLETELLTHGQPNEEFIPDEEGRRVIRVHVSYERSPRNRSRALEIHGNRCMACGFSFDERYGAAHARGFIEIHHVKSLTQATGLVNPETDLISLCSNCHSMAHRERGTILSLERIKALLRGST
jgi:5-methylcytosine-specific restriction enzyme A